MKKLPIGIQSIEKILFKNDYIYVDKTPFVLQLIEGDAPHYFFSRPRCFGKEPGYGAYQEKVQKDVSSKDQEDKRKRTSDEASKEYKSCQNYTNTPLGRTEHSG